MLTPEYVAGFIDGEGCIRIARHKRKGKDYYYGEILVSNTNLEILEKLKAQFGGSVTNHGKEDPEFNRKQSWAWHIGEGHTRAFLEDIKFLLVVKRPAASLVLDFIYYKKDNIPIDQPAWKEASLKLNHRGI